jgi:2-C-methyl-D-erythritol 4-phosphate cytidylyltransferase
VTTLTALVLAGTRAGGDPLASGEGVSHKALIAVAGRAMIEHVVLALDAVPEIGRIVIAIERPEALEGLPGLRLPGCRHPVSVVAAAVTLPRFASATVASASAGVASRKLRIHSGRSSG